jgi:hypothetical protein
MGILCSIWGCSDEPKDFWGDNAEYVLFKCRRCGNETIFCSKEVRILKNDEEGRKIRDLMITDPEFSRQCTIHDQFVKAEDKNAMNLSKREKALDEIRERYGLAPGFRQPDPVILWQKGLWRPKPSGEARESKPKRNNPKRKTGEKPIHLEGGENFPEQDNVVKVEIRITKPNGGGENSGSEWEDITVNGQEPKQELSVEAQISRLERRMDKHVAREEYEKAARLRDQIVKLKAGEKQ